MSKLLSLLKYLEYIELFEAIGKAAKAVRTGDDWELHKTISIKGHKKYLSVVCADVQNETGDAIWHTEGE